MVALKKILCLASLMLLSACAVNVEKHSYQFALPKQKKHRPQSRLSLFVAKPKAPLQYSSQDMLYQVHAYQLEPFAKNEWAAPPAEMLYPILVESLQNAGNYRVVIAEPLSAQTNRRLDTEILKLEQNFLTKPSRLELKLKLTLSNRNNGRVLRSKVISLSQPCPQETPYGGVIAANIALKKALKQAQKFV